MDLNGIRDNECLFIAGNFSDPGIVGQLEKLSRDDPFDMGIGNIGPHGVYDDFPVDFGLSFGIGQDGSNLQALDLVYMLDQKGLLKPRFHYIGAGFSKRTEWEGRKLATRKGTGNFSPR